MPRAEVRALVPFVMLLFVAALGFEMFGAVRSVSNTMPGFGFQPVSGLHVDLAYYHVFENEISRPMWSSAGPIPGSSVSSKMSEDSVVMTFSFHPAK